VPTVTTVPVRFDESVRQAVYRVMALRRDVREFVPGEVDDATLGRLLQAAALAPSVGFSQPWAFVVVRDPTVRSRIRASFLQCREGEAARYPAARRDKYLAYKLEGIEESTLNLCVVADLRPRGEAILGTTAQPEAVRASVCCAVQNLWLAARAEGIGMGWVSLFEPEDLRTLLRMPEGSRPVAVLCLGHVTEFYPRPMLEMTEWTRGCGIADLVHTDYWSDAAGRREEGGGDTAD